MAASDTAQAVSNGAQSSRGAGEPILSARCITVRFGQTTVLQDLDLDVYAGEILGFIGPSGAGKSVLLRAILGLNRKAAGTIRLFGTDIEKLSEEQRIAVDMQLGVLFQHGALFSSLTVLENIQIPMREYLDLSDRLMDELSRLKLELVGLPQSAATKLPSELSGGMTKRAALARALALDPAIVFLDEPTSGLDPIGAAEFDELIAKLRDTMGLTVYMVTHDLDSLFSVCDRIAALGDGKVEIEGTIDDMLAYDGEWVKAYFRGKRARMIPSRDRAASRRQPSGGQG